MTNVLNSNIKQNRVKSNTVSDNFLAEILNQKRKLTELGDISSGSMITNGFVIMEYDSSTSKFSLKNENIIDGGTF